jgi:carbamoylphosphate synthase large subunit
LITNNKRQKRILFLGGAVFQLPSLLYAREKGYYTIICDNKPDNPGHKLAHKSYIVSTRDKNSVLRIADKEKIDGIITFGSDISAPTVAYVSQKLGLPGNPVDTVHTLTDKYEFRNFLNNSGIQKIQFETFNENEFKKATDYVLGKKVPLIIKPIDNSGSRGIGIVKKYDHISSLIANAFRESFSKKIIIEDFIDKSGKQVCGDGYFEGNKLKYIFFGDGHYYDDEVHNAPWGETFPSSHSQERTDKVRDKIELVLKEVGFIKGPFNFDVLFDKNGDCFIIEIGPRSGGNFISEAIKLKYNIDLFKAGVEAALDGDFSLEDVVNEDKHFYGCYMVHSSLSAGLLIDFVISEEIKGNIHQVNRYLDPGDKVRPFHSAGNAISNIVLKFHSFQEMNKLYENLHSYFKVNLHNDNHTNL